MTQWTSQWDGLTAELAVAIADLPWNWFLIVECEPGPGQRMGPYAQVSRYAAGLHVEAVSEEYLPADQWPIDEQALRHDGWCPPGAEVDNWWQEVDDPASAAQIMMRSLVLARGCADPGRMSWGTGQHPDPPGDGEPLPVGVIDVAEFAGSTGRRVA